MGGCGGGRWWNSTRRKNQGGGGRYSRSTGRGAATRLPKRTPSSPPLKIGPFARVAGGVAKRHQIGWGGSSPAKRSRFQHTFRRDDETRLTGLHYGLAFPLFKTAKVSHPFKYFIQWVYSNIISPFRAQCCIFCSSIHIKAALAMRLHAWYHVPKRRVLKHLFYPTMNNKKRFYHCFPRHLRKEGRPYMATYLAIKVRGLPRVTPQRAQQLSPLSSLERLLLTCFPAYVLLFFGELADRWAGSAWE